MNLLLRVLPLAAALPAVAAPCLNPIFASAETRFFGIDVTLGPLADLNADAVADRVLFFHHPDGTVTLHTQLGGVRGLLLAPGSTPVNGPIKFVKVADFNADGALDLVWSDLDGAGPTFTIVFGNGDGTFGAAATALGSPPPVDDYYDSLGYGVFDLDQDGDPDIVYWYCLEQQPVCAYQVLLNDGHGVCTRAPELDRELPFGDPQVVSTFEFHDEWPGLELRVRVEDHEYAAPHIGSGMYGSLSLLDNPLLTHDDIILARVGNDRDEEFLVPQPGGISVLFHTGSAFSSFTTRSINLGMPLTPRSLALADFNADGYQDLIAFDHDRSGFTTAINDRHLETYVNPVFHAPALTTGEFADVNADGLPDLVSGFSTIPATAPGEFADRPSYPTAGAAPLRIALADMNADGGTDWVILHRASEEPAPIEVMLRQGDGSYVSAGHWAAGINPTVFAVADMNADTIPDVVTASTGELAVLLGNADGTLAPAITTPISVSGFPSTVTNPTALALGDVTGDGMADAFVADAELRFGITPTRAFVLPGNADGTFSAPIMLDLPHTNTGVAAYDAALTDLDGDSDLDLILLRVRAETYLNPGDGTFTTPHQSIPMPSAVANALTLSDLDGDGDDDLLVAAPLAPNLTDGLLLFDNQGGSFAAPIPLNTTSTPRSAGSVMVTDFDADGVADLGVTYEPYAVEILRGLGGGQYLPITRVRKPESANSYGASVIQDVDLDGLPDFVLVYFSFANVQVELNAGCPFRTACPVDLDADADVDLDDLALYVQAFLAGDPDADLSGPHRAADGFLNLDDIDAFVALFLAGCK